MRIGRVTTRAAADGVFRLHIGAFSRKFGALCDLRGSAELATMAMRLLISQMLFLCVRGYVALGTAPGTVGRSFRGSLALPVMTAPDPASTDQSLPAVQQLAPDQWTVRATAGRATQQRHIKVESNSKVTLAGGASKKKLFVTERVRLRNSSPAAERVHELGALAGSAMPPASKVDDPELGKEHSFSRDASWLIPGYVLCGSYPGASPGRASDNGLLSQVRAAGVHSCAFRLTLTLTLTLTRCGRQA